VAAALHLGLGLLLIGLFDMGIVGAAIATVTAQAAASLFGAFYLYTNQRKFVFDSYSKNLLPAPKHLGQILKIGVPFGLQMCLLHLSHLFILRLVNTYGVAASAALGAGSRVSNVLVVPMLAIGNAASTIVGQNLGAGKADRASAAIRWAALYTLIFAGLTTALTLLFPTRLLALFTDDPDVLQIGVQYLTILAWCYAGHALHSSCNAAMLGAGLSLYSLAAAGVEALVGRVGLTWIFSGLFGLPGIFTAQAIAPYLAAALSLTCCFTVRWQNAREVDKNTS
jgi:putative MATE family efflux protein